MPSPEEIADKAHELARRAVDDLTQYIGDGWSENDEADIQLAVSDEKSGATSSKSRETWEHFAAINLVIAARCVERTST